MSKNDIKIEKCGCGFSVEAGCKKYAFNEKSPILSQVEANGKQLLASPIRVVCKNGKNSFCVSESKFFKTETDGELFLSSSAENQKTVINVVSKIEEDGLLDVTLSVMPSGLSGMENFGLGDLSTKRFRLDGLYVEIPINKNNVEFSHIFPIGDYVRDGENIGNDCLRLADYLPKTQTNCGFKQQVLIMGDDCGLGVFFENDKDIVYGEKDKFFEIINGENEYVLRFRLIDALPKEWNIPEEYLRDTELWQIHVFPLSFKFGLQALPVKKWDYSKGFERNLHIECFRENDYDYMWKPAKEGSDESRLDLIKRMGVKVIYAHECWDDFQNSPVINEESAERLKKLVDACHERGIKLVPYFGYEISTLSPLFAKYGKKFLRVSENNPNLGWHYYRYPAQRDIPVCLNNEWKDIFFEGLAAIQTEFNFDGFYLDGTVWPIICKNLEHGCGFYKDGELHGTHAVFAQREFMKKLYGYCESRGLVINVHPDGAINLATIAYTTSVWDGEFFQAPLLNGQLNEVPEPLIRTQYSGACTGIPVFALCYSNPPKWNFRQAAALSLLYGTLPKPGDLDAQLEISSKLWDIFEEFMTENVKFHAYYEQNKNAPVKLSGAEHVKLSYFETDSEILAIVCCVKKDICEKASFVSEYPIVLNAENGDIVTRNGTAEFEFSNFDFKLLKIKK